MLFKVVFKIVMDKKNVVERRD